MRGEEKSAVPASLLAMVSQQVSAYSGPIPPPQLLKQYDELVPGAASQILNWADRQTQHRISLEAQTVRSDIWRSYFGLAAGFILSMTAVVGGCLVAYSGHDGAGATIATASVVGLAGVFVYGTVSRRREREEKTRIATGRSK